MELNNTKTATLTSSSQGRAAGSSVGNKRIVYSRDELFRLASQMPGHENWANELNDYRNPDWVALQLELVDSSEPNYQEAPKRSLASFGRKRSELMGHGPGETVEPKSMIGHSINHKKLFRMTSSPSIRYNNSNSHHINNGSGAGPLQPLEGLSSQVRAKYARLLETMSSSSSGKEAASRRVLMDTPIARVADPPAARRPTQLFGPLRRRSDDNRRGSDEPMSLPYSINLNSDRPIQSRAGAHQMVTRASSLLGDESPIKRIEAARGSPGESNKFMVNGQLQDGDEDDFDITSLLSITVLSDIRTIRQSELNNNNNSQHSHQKLTRQSSRPTVQRTRSHDMPARMPERSSSSLEFGSYVRSQQRNLRASKQAPSASFAVAHPRQQLLQATRQQQQLLTSSDLQERERHLAYRLNATSPEPLSLGQSESLPYSWQTNGNSSSLYVNPELALKYHLKNKSELERLKSRNASKPVDEKVVKIIETFKAQVKARAEAPAQDRKGPREGVEGPKPHETQRSEETTKEVERVRENSVRPVSSEPITNSGEPSANESKENSKQRVGEPTQKQLEDETKSSELAPTNTSPIETTPKSSNIPRLISLYRARSNPQATELANQTTSVRTDSRANIKPGGKFVSQYKELRGKSLADEVHESRK